MKTNTRYIKSILKASQDADVKLPWQRGKRRAEFIARRARQDDTRRIA